MDANIDLFVKHFTTDECDKAAQTYLKYCERLDLDPKWLHSKVKSKVNGKTSTVAGLVKRGALTMIIIQPDMNDSAGFFNCLTIREFEKNFELDEI